ncbi:invasion associated locus B family protein [Salinimonas lutimaris]|uniref:invasion associated locus B family protein n=1 Tax=Salinimonas lutimaris TaxID=914153 RepID=UPI0010C061B3|nr:invasion associated locus B family protein [Salinimonas lutimaris]
MKKIIPLLLSLLPAPLIAQSVSTTDFDSWSLLCGEHGNCSLSQMVSKDPAGKHIVLGVNVTYAISPDFPVLQLRFPPNAMKTAGFGIKVGDDKPVQLPFSQCTDAACQAVVKMDEPLIKSMKNNSRMLVVYADAKQKQKTLPVSLIGFAEGFTALNQ